MARSKAEAPKSGSRKETAQKADTEEESNAGNNGSGPVSVTAFMVRRALAGVYLSAFLSLLAQVDGLFSCSGLYPTPVSPVLYVIALLGSIVAALAFLAVRALERNALAIFASLWGMFAAVVHLAPGGYGQLEDRLVLDLGLVCLLLVPVRPSKEALEMGQSVAAWLLFRALFSVTAGKMVNSSTWRDLTALHHTGWLEPFPLPTAWLLFKAPLSATAPLTLLLIWAELVVSMLVLPSAQGIRQMAVSFLMVVVAGATCVANRGCFTPCIFTLLFAQMDDDWHRGTWSAIFLENWGLPPRPGDKRSGRRSRNTSSTSAGQKTSTAEGSQPLGWAVGAFLFLGTLVVIALGVLAGLAAADGDSTATDAAGGAVAAIHAVVAGRSSAEWMVAVEVLALIAIVISLFPVLGSSAAPSTKIVGLLFWAAGSVHLAREIAPVPIKTVATPVSAVLELAHVSHSFWPSEAELAPRPDAQGVPVVTFEALTKVTDTIDTRGRAMNSWSQIGPRFQPFDEIRPPLLQPYTPRLDLALWNLAWQVERRVTNKTALQASIPMPSWFPQLADALYRRKGDSVRLVVGPLGWWGSLLTPLYMAAPGLSKYIAETEHGPLQRLRMVWMRRRYTTDIHENRWWEHVPRNTEDHLRVLFDMQLEQVDASNFELYPNPSMILDSKEAESGIRSVPPSCVAFPWEGLPAAEVLVATTVAAFATILLTPP